MSRQYYSLCKRNHGRAIFIRTHEGREFRGFIRGVDSRHVYIQPLRPRRGFGYGYYFPRRRFREGVAVGVALGSIATLFLISPFFFF
ncbi:MAG TPA: hypothetical protein VIG73_04995 [Cerasibacillus sp.]|uniref:hypothetical protein n=1 Tax=Cerasibacillus sp. TaxID=2498711 RepID=UPI002F403795